MDNLTYIDNYFTGESAFSTKEEFEKRITSSSEFAEEVAFYLSAKQIAAGHNSNSGDRFRELYAKLKKDDSIPQERTPVQRKLWPYIAAAATVAAIVVGWAVFFRVVSPSVLAEKYIQENFQSLGVTMGGTGDSLQAGLRLYNDGKPQEALQQFESILTRDSSSFEAKKYAGIVSLRMNDYDKAILYFSQLADYTQLYANPGKFYHALTLLKRDRPGDKQDAENLLKQVVQHDLEGQDIAREWLRDF